MSTFLLLDPKCRLNSLVLSRVETCACSTSRGKEPGCFLRQQPGLHMPDFVSCTNRLSLNPFSLPSLLPLSFMDRNLPVSAQKMSSVSWRYISFFSQVYRLGDTWEMERLEKRGIISIWFLPSSPKEAVKSHLGNCGIVGSSLRLVQRPHVGPGLYTHLKR